MADNKKNKPPEKGASEQEPDWDLHDAMVEDMTRGRRRPKKAVSLAEKRKLLKLFNMIKDGNCDERDYCEAIRDLGPQEGSPEFLYFLDLWRRYRGKA